ncbi:bifunctional levopimaradiene synthase, chloroplastic isoform X1 [Cryptomeria japonica]|uniref:bifunctional levopimaradiene synthase, chloroplastic isoform X1 n=1 Tax=Cryptomeria japonica TaxID=3369 RepID=UPI0027DAA6AD|nr:bifunctional levopimaradiene synthase, chloroplastic isoform X1 [Cryptomeria japonica]
MAATVYPPSMWNDDAINSLTEIHMPLEHHKHIEALIEDIRNMFQSMEDGKLNPSAYDTAWIARIASIDNPSQPQFPQTLNWVVCNQLSDGSWGGEPFYLSHDRLLITLSCVIALRIWKLGETQVQKGIDFVNYQTSLSLDERGYGNQPSGFVILFSSLLKEANALNLGISNELPFIQRILAIREAQLKENDMGILYNLPTSLFLSLEGLQEVIDWRKVLKFYPKDGYMLGSLASTACLYMHTGDKIFLEFINSVVTICGDHVPCVYPSDLHERLLAVDTVERLGIGRYFKEEIKHALDYVYRFWSNGGIGRGRNDTIVNVNDTAMGFRILRLHGYDVSAEVLKIFENEKREFFSFADKTHRGVEDMLSLYKCSEIGFPGETVMKEAKTFTATYLRNLRETNNSFALARDVSGSFAVDYELKYGFHRSLPRLEARFYIEGSWLSNKTWLAKTFYRLPYMNNEKYIELAKLDFNAVQSIHQKELQQVHKWWIDSGFRKLKFTRERHIEIYFVVAAGMFEPDYGDCRIATTKVGCLIVILDDLYDKYSSFEEIMLFNEVFERWDLYMLDHMSEHIKIFFLGLYNTINELAEKACKVQGNEMLEYFKKMWKVQLESFTKEAEWSKHKHVPRWDEYITISKVSIGFGTSILTSIHLMGEVITDSILCQIDERSKAHYLVCLSTRLVNDTKTFKAEREYGELASAIECYMKDNPRALEEVALDHVYDVIEDGLTELNQELFKYVELPSCFQNLLLN